MLLRLVFTSCKQAWQSLLRPTEAAELIEFAASLPLLVVFVVGVYDFSSAFILKQKIAHVAAEAARVAANQPMSDLSTAGCPPSICSIRDVVHTALANNGINDCGLNGATAVHLTPNLTWKFTASGSGCTGSLTLRIERGYTYTATLPEPPFQANYTIEATKVTLSYPHQWQFNHVVGFIAPGASYANNDIQSTAVAQNLN